MKEIPILFSTTMVQAILEGQKTMTRRIIDPQPESGKYPQSELEGFYWKNKFYLPKYDRKDISLVDNSRFGKPGDMLWVRETMIFNKNSETYWPVADGYVKTSDWEKVVPSIHVPKKHSRIWLQVEEIRVERLQDISQEDAIAEGITPYFDKMVSGTRYTYKQGMLSNSVTPKREFTKLWIEINGEESWDANPWVWVVKYKVLSITGKPT